MWKYGCLDVKRTHVEDRAHERLLKIARDYQETLIEDEIKEKILELMKTSKSRNERGIDRETRLPKYFLTGRLPDYRNIWVMLCIVEDVENKNRMIKTVWSGSEVKKPGSKNKLGRRKRIER
ncbi:hypothetical protein LCGC14_0761970 [marine sediment metagenome]|uniref:Uncharacterized protein n=1 Tax=marine sediment metagenome TaxID=412755 RepID=A0A0F9SKV7_9ZZZZ|nr:hypothetical protein [bacterium]